MKTLLIDIETAPVSAFAWGLFKQTINPDWVTDSGRVLCFAAKWLGDDDITFVSEHGTKGAHKRMIRRAHALLSEADALVHYNGNSFDVPTLNKEFLQYGMRPPSPAANIDLLRVMRKTFRFPSNKLAFIAKSLGIGGKLPHCGPAMWLQCMEGDADAWAAMEAYNRQDVVVLEDVYFRLLPWIQDHPHTGVRSDSPEACPNCGGTHLQARGWAYTRLSKYRRFQCTDCGTWTRGSKRELGAKIQVAV